jgi:NADPH:quinone reductase-like Zn-dependent oxidoreductase
MKNIVIDRPGGYRQLTLREDQAPSPRENEVLEKVADAHRVLESGTTVGKIILKPS